MRGIRLLGHTPFLMRAGMMRAMQTSRPLSLTVSIVLHFSPIPFLHATLRGLLRAAQSLTYPSECRVLLIDQSLCPNYQATVLAALADFSQGSVSVEYVASVSNKGFGAGHNQSLERAPATFHLILNPDAELAAEALEEGINCLLTAPQCVAVTPVARRGDGTPEYLAKAYPSVCVLALRAFAPPWVRRWCNAPLARYELRERLPFRAIEPVPLASGCCMLVRQDVLRAIGGFDESFFLYFEDYDLSLRLQSHGEIWQLAAMTIVHHGGMAARKGWRHIRWFLRGGVRFFQRYGWRWC
jgi:hypothetical protein